jgi:RsiW-degrading membrane proteinase PrsW (M82 family)
MAAADSSTATNYIPILVAILPAVLSPIVPWVLGRSKVSKEAATIDYLNKRLDILERLNKLDTQLTEGPLRPFLDTEIEHCRTFLHERPAFITHDAEVAVAAPQSRWGRFFLTQPAVSMRKRIFKGLFYFFFAIAVLYAPVLPIVVSSESSGEDRSVLVLSFIAGFVFYLGLALLFRRAARN